MKRDKILKQSNMAQGQRDVKYFVQKQSNEVETWVFLLEAGVHDWWCVATSSSLSDKRGESVSVSDYRRFFDGSAHVVVGEAQLVGERFEHVR